MAARRYRVLAMMCSAKGCRARATWALRWNNPRLHPPQRRKTWLACDDHRDHLRDFLAARGFLRELDPLPPDGSPSPDAPSAADDRPPAEEGRSGADGPG